GRKLAYLMKQVRIVLITQRRNESLVVAACILAVTRGTPLHIRRLAERYPLAAAGLRRYGGLQPIEVCGDVGPFLRIVHLALHERAMHVDGLALQLCEIGQLLDQVSASLPS